MIRKNRHSERPGRGPTARFSLLAALAAAMLLFTASAAYATTYSYLNNDLVSTSYESPSCRNATTSYAHRLTAAAATIGVYALHANSLCHWYENVCYDESNTSEAACHPNGTKSIQGDTINYYSSALRFNANLSY